MNNWVWLTIGISIVLASYLVPFPQIELICLRVLFVNVNLAYMLLCKGKVEQGSAIPFAFLRRQHKQHLHHIIAQSHECHNIGLSDNIQLYRLEISVQYA